MATAGLSSRSSTRRRRSEPSRKARRRTRWAYAGSCSRSRTSTTSLPACAATAPSSSTRSRSTRTCIGSASCVALRASSSDWPSSSAETSMNAHRPLITRGYVRRMVKRARTTAGLLVAILMGGGTITALASTGSSSETSPAPVTTPYHPAFDAANFGGPIDNRWLPLKPGTVFRYRGVGDNGRTRELNTVRVTHRKKRIMGVEATVVLDRVFSEGKPEERTFDWYAQANEGNVW